MSKLILTLRIVATAIIGQSLFFKFSGAAEAVHIFSTLGVEPLGRYATAVIELLTVVLLLIPGQYLLGALLAAGTMVGAVFSHIFVLGIEVQEDGGTLFIMALVTLAASSLILWLERNEAISKFTEPLLRLGAKQS